MNPNDPRTPAQLAPAANAPAAQARERRALHNLATQFRCSLVNPPVRSANGGRLQSSPRAITPALVSRRHWLRSLACASGFLGWAFLVAALFADPAKSRYEFREVHDPNGTGWFYMDREIALVMGHRGMGWLERPERVQEEAPTLLLDSLNLKPGDVVADVGAGTGYHSFPIAERVGPEGKVYAVDIQPEMLTVIRKRMEERGVTNVEPILGKEDDPNLPANSIDLFLMVDVYHEFSKPWEMIDAMIKALKPGGRIVFVEFRKEDPKVLIKLVHKMTEQQVIKEMSVFPLDYVGTVGVLPMQHIIIFRKK